MAPEKVEDEALSDMARPATRTTKLEMCIDEREYDVFTVGSLFRETEAQSKLHHRCFDHRYTYCQLPSASSERRVIGHQEARRQLCSITKVP